MRVLVIALLWAVGFSQFLTCAWTDPNTGAYFNLRSLYHNTAQGDYIGTDVAGYRYYMNICGASNLGGECSEKGGLLCQFLQGAYVNMIASWTDNPRPVWSLINNANPNIGVDLLYANGDPCYDQNNAVRYTNMTFFCDPNAPVSNYFNIWENAGEVCTYHVSYTTPGACPQGAAPERLVTGEVKDITLSQNGWIYYQIDVAANIQELQVTTMQKSSQGYVQLFVRYGAQPTDQAYDRADMSFAQKHTVSVRRDDPYANSPLLTGTYYIGVKAMSADVTLSLTPYAYVCYNNCSGHGSCVYDPTSGWSVCQCNAGYDSNFNDCSAQVVDAQLGATYSGTLVDDQWRYYRYTITDTNAYQLFVEMSRSPNDNQQALPTLLIKQTNWPTYSDNDGLVQDTVRPSQNWELELTPPVLTTGTWIVAVVGNWDYSFTYSLQTNLYDCDHGCSGNGVCDPPTHVCTCNNGYGDLDCSLLETPLPFNQSVSITVPAYEIGYFVISIPTLAADSRVDLMVEVVEDDPHSFPRLMINPGSLGIPTDAANFMATPLPTGPRATIRVPASSLETYDKDGKWYLGVSSLYWENLSVKVRLTYEGYCPNDCSFQGTCIVTSSYQVYCQCNAGWTGAGCDVLPTSSSGVDDGAFAGIVIALLVVGMVLGYLIKAKFPHLCQSQSSVSSGARKTQYAAISDEA